MKDIHLLTTTSIFSTYPFEPLPKIVNAEALVKFRQNKIFSSSLYGGIQRMANSHPKVYVNGERYFDFDCWGGTVTINKPRFKGECYMVVDYAIEREQYILNRHHDHFLQ
jgi:hypothetical protein